MKKADKFEPHMMYDPKTGKGYKANTIADHLRMKKKGYTHTKPKKKAEQGMRLKKKKDILGREKLKIKTEDGTKTKIVKDKDGNVIKRTVVDRDKFGIKRRTTTKTKPGKKKKTVIRGGYAKPFDSPMGVGEGAADAVGKAGTSGLAKIAKEIAKKK